VAAEGLKDMRSLKDINTELKTKKEKLIYTVVSGNYEQYEPLFRYCAEMSHPDAEVRVDKIAPKVKYHAAVERFLRRPGDHHRVYITDVDLFFLPGPLWEYHEGRMAQTGLCFSNSPRRREALGNVRLTGLHMATQEWYDRTADKRAEYADMINHRRWGRGPVDDELALYRICEPIGIPPKEPLIQRHFGIHVGVVRNTRIMGREYIDDALQWRITPDDAKMWADLVDTEECRRCINEIIDPRVRAPIELVATWCRDLAQQVCK